MKKIVPFKKEIIFKTNISEIVSISLEHNLQIESKNLIEGKFLVSGEYKITDSSTMSEPFSYDLPFSINMDDRYILDNTIVDIDDFYYEIINDNVLSVNIEVLIDKLEEKELEKPFIEVETLDEDEIIESKPIGLLEKDELIQPLEINDPVETLEREEIMENKIEEKVQNEEIDKRCVEPEESSIFEQFNSNIETYKSYTIYIMRDGDSLDMLLEKYEITKEILAEYNDLDELKVGDKLIIPC